MPKESLVVILKLKKFFKDYPAVTTVSLFGLQECFHSSKIPMSSLKQVDSFMLICVMLR